MARVPLHWMEAPIWISLHGGMLRVYVCALEVICGPTRPILLVSIETEAVRNISGNTGALHRNILSRQYRSLNTYIDITKHRAATHPDILPPEPTTSFRLLHKIIPSHTIVPHKKLFQSFPFIVCSFEGVFLTCYSVCAPYIDNNAIWFLVYPSRMFHTCQTWPYKIWPET